MPIIKSAKKRVKVAAKAATRNSKTKRDLKDALKSFYAALTGGKAEKVSAAHVTAVSAIDTAAKKNVIHKNKAARKKQQLAVAMKKANIKPLIGKKAAAKPAKATTVKKVTTKPIANKPVAKKTVKKPAAKPAK
jgi:small subunit ribosomal protein S20